MEHEETKHRQGSVKRPINTATIDKTEAGPSRLYAPGKPHEVESGPSRLRTFVPSRHQTGSIHTATSIRHPVGVSIDTTEAGPARIERYPR